MATITADKNILLQLQKQPVLAELIQQFGPYHWNLNTPFETLVRAVIGQVISATAAKTVYQRLLTNYGQQGQQPLHVEQLQQADIKHLRTLGLSRQKAQTIIGLSQWWQTIAIDQWIEQSNQTIIRELTALPGIGEWTAQMFLIFALGRLDIWPITDLGVVNAARQLYAIEGKQELRNLGKKISPYESVVTWYFWQYVVNHQSQSN